CILCRSALGSALLLVSIKVMVNRAIILRPVKSIQSCGENAILDSSPLAILRNVCFNCFISPKAIKIHYVLSRFAYGYLLLITCLLCLLPTVSRAERRTALVIGNAGYE